MLRLFPRFLQLDGGNQLHCPGDLSGALDTASSSLNVSHGSHVLNLCDRLFQKCIRLVRNHFLGADRLWNFRIFLIEECEKFLFEPGNLVNLYIQQIFSGCHIQRDNLVFYRHGLILRLL